MPPISSNFMSLPDELRGYLGLLYCYFGADANYQKAAATLCCCELVSIGLFFCSACNSLLLRL